MKVRVSWVSWLLTLVLLLSAGAPLAAAPAIPPIMPPILPPITLKPDLSVSVTGPTEWVQGQPLNDLVKLTVKNEGIVKAPGETDGVTNEYAVDLILSSDATEIRLARIDTRRILEPNEAATFTPSATIPEDAPPGTYCLKGVVDPTNKVAETNEGNNTFCHTVTIKKRTIFIPIMPVPIQPLIQPDLTISMPSAPSAVLQGDDISLKLTVKNQGVVKALGHKPGQSGYEIDVVLSKTATLPVAYAEASTTFKDGALLTGGRVSTTVDLAGGASAEYPVTVHIPSNTPTGSYCLGLVVDPGKAVSESVETNNTHCHTIEVKKDNRVLPLPLPPFPPPVPIDPPIIPIPPVPVDPPIPPIPPIPIDPPVIPIPPIPIDPVQPPETCTTQKFTDLPISHRACAAVSLLATKGIVNGFEDGTFRPDKPVTRAEFAKMFTLTKGLAPRPLDRLTFSDTTEHWAAAQGYLAAAVAVEAINGFPDGTFRPDDLVTRAQGVKIAGVGLSFSPQPELPEMPADITAADWFRDHVSIGLKAGLMGSKATFPPFTDAAFKGDNPMTRAEAALLLANLWLLVKP